MENKDDDVPLNAVRAFVVIAREGSVTRAAKALRTRQSSVSRFLSVLEEYMGAELIERRGRGSTLTEFGRNFASAVADPLESVCFTTQRMRRRSRADINRIVVRTSLSTLAYTLLIPKGHEFSNETGGAVVDVVSSMSPPASSDSFDVLFTRDLIVAEPADQWVVYQEELVCVGASVLVDGKNIASLSSVPIVTVNSRPDILPTWLQGMGMNTRQIVTGARYDHHFLALPAAIHGKCLFITPEIIVGDLVRDGILAVVPGTRVASGMQYRAYALDRSGNPDLARAYCRWLVRIFRREGDKSGI
ncbi:LysR family transcriptional regulator [Agrobacterium tumefaciens]|uniref:LysR family transcriptional regulator n=1 Tax=Agrobacterium tumefaciens TaxID=358 RepID=UPI0015743E81|nr:LysR family transcriptional regulator [Agrobacterium tumefaciens]NTE66241.1 LysR family transcriptional regulator [Agrobacterium tumefaciens]